MECPLSTPLFLTRANLEGVYQMGTRILRLSEGGATYLGACLVGMVAWWGLGHCLEGEWKSTGDEHRRSHTAPAAQHIFRCGSCLAGYLIASGFYIWHESPCIDG